jgi:hypothetical protein
MARYLRIAVAVVFALLAVAFFAFWVRSHYYRDLVLGMLTETHYVWLLSEWNVVTCVIDEFDHEALEWELNTNPIAFEPINARWRQSVLRGLGFKYAMEAGRFELAIPHWFPALILGALAAMFAFKRPWRFTTRRLLVITALFALAIWFGVSMY